MSFNRDAATNLKLKLKEGNGKLKRCTNICHNTSIKYEMFQINIHSYMLYACWNTNIFLLTKILPVRTNYKSLMFNHLFVFISKQIVFWLWNIPSTMLGHRRKFLNMWISDWQSQIPPTQSAILLLTAIYIIFTKWCKWAASHTVAAWYILMTIMLSPEYFKQCGLFSHLWMMNPPYQSFWRSVKEFAFLVWVTKTIR